jgi:hypothetical protein
MWLNLNASLLRSGEIIARMIPARKKEKIDWIALENVGGGLKILHALQLALNKKTMREIERESHVPYSSLNSIKIHGPYEHRNRAAARRKVLLEK